MNNQKPLFQYQDLPLDQQPLIDLDKNLQKYVWSFEHLNADNLFRNLAPQYSEDIVFKDPFNHTQGKKQTLNVFSQMFKELYRPTFTVHYAHRHKQQAYLHWQFNFAVTVNGNLQTIDGMSLISFDEQGLINSHIDYWDPTEPVYKKIPLLKSLVTLVCNKLSAKNKA